MRNKGGGNKNRGAARKGGAAGGARGRAAQRVLHLATETGEVYAQAVKVLGGQLASAIDLQGRPLMVHIRGKFRGKNKRDNFISPGTWLLVGLFDFTAGGGSGGAHTEAARHGDLMEVYTDAEKLQLRNQVTSVNWDLFMQNDQRAISKEMSTIAAGSAGGEPATTVDFVDDDAYVQHMTASAGPGAGAPSSSAVVAATTETASICVEMGGKIVDVDDI